MDRLNGARSHGGMTTTTNPTDASPLAAGSLAHPTWREVAKRIASRSFCLLATTSPAGRAHVAGVLYDEADGALYISIERQSRKGRNLAANPHVAVTVPVRRIPVGPPATAMFSSTAEVLDNDDPHVLALAADGKLSTITGHGELEILGGCIVRVAPPRVVHTYGLGLSLLSFVRHPLQAGGRVERPGDELGGEPGHRRSAPAAANTD